VLDPRPVDAAADRLVGRDRLERRQRDELAARQRRAGRTDRQLELGPSEVERCARARGAAPDRGQEGAGLDEREDPGRS
jgi:hypothetical protein